MSTHTVTEDELSDFIEDQRELWLPFATSSGADQEVKRLQYRLGNVAPIYRVTLGQREIYVGALKATAVREYNALP